MATITLTDEALPIARAAATEQGMDLAAWLCRAINEQAQRDQPVVEVPYDDCGFYSPLAAA